MRQKGRICGKSGTFDVCCVEFNHHTKSGPNRTIIVQVTAILSPLGTLASLGFEPITLGLPQDIYCTQHYAPPTNGAIILFPDSLSLRHAEAFGRKWVNLEAHVAT